MPPAIGASKRIEISIFTLLLCIKAFVTQGYGIVNQINKELP
jgi:hypothetical protein